jgi:hypothetical protein
VGRPPAGHVDPARSGWLTHTIGKRSVLGLVVLAAAVCSGCASGVTGLPANLTGNSATVNGTVGTSSGGSVEYWVEYGPTTSYGLESSHQTTNVAAHQTEGVQAFFGGLQLDTTYHYRVCARDSQQGGAPGCGADRTLRTQSINCGDTITHDVKLSGPMNCAFVSTVDGFTIGAPGLDINLASYALTGGPLAVGFRNDGHDDVTIRNGSMTGWATAIAIGNASRNSIRGIDGSTFSIGGGTGNEIHHSEGRFFIASDGLVLADSHAIAGFGSRSSPAIAVDSNGGRFVHNVIQGVPFEPGIVVNGDGNRIVESELQGSSEGCIAIESGQGNVVRENDVHDCPTDAAGTDPVRVGDGIFVAAAANDTLLRANTSFDNGDDGIDTRSPSTRLLSNEASGNADFGIDAVPGVTDLGGNTASLNGNPLQCRNVFCG